MPDEMSGKTLIWASAPEGQQRVACVMQDGATYVEFQADNGLPCASIAMMPRHAVAMARAIIEHETKQCKPTNAWQSTRPNLADLHEVRADPRPDAGASGADRLPSLWLARTC